MLNEPFDGDRPQAEAPQEPPGGRSRWIWGAAIALIACAFAVHWWRSQAEPPPAPEVQKPAPDPAAEAAAQQAADEKAARALKASGEATDDKLRRQLGALSDDAAWKSWVAATPDLLESGAVIIANVADDEDPRKRLTPLRPDGDFGAVEQGGQWLESPDAQHRFDGPVNAISSINSAALAPLWRTLHPLVSVAYHAVGRPGISLDKAASTALHRIGDARLPAAPQPLQKTGKLWIYNEPDVEKLGPVEKQLMRLGPDNARKLQAKARELRAALGLP